MMRIARGIGLVFFLLGAFAMTLVEGKAPPLPEGCFWHGWTTPSVKWGENNLCSIITAPANTWSNLAYLAVGVLVWLDTRRRRVGRSLLGAFGFVTIATGIASFLYHASYTAFFQYFDFAAMFLFCSLPLVLNAGRLKWVTRDRQLDVCLGTMVGCCLLLPPLLLTPVPIQGMVLLLILLILGQEIAIRIKRPGSAEYRWLFAALGLIIAGAVCSFLDIHRIWYDPDNHILQGHAVWHVLSALSLGALFRFYLQFDNTQAEE